MDRRRTAFPQPPSLQIPTNALDDHSVRHEIVRGRSDPFHGSWVRLHDMTQTQAHTVGVGQSRAVPPVQMYIVPLSTCVHART